MKLLHCVVGVMGVRIGNGNDGFFFIWEDLNEMKREI